MSALAQFRAQPLGPQNRHVLDALKAAHRCALVLSHEGFTVLQVEVAGRNPVVWIQNCGRVADLRGAARVYRSRGEGHYERLMVALREGCQVQWHVRGH